MDERLKMIDSADISFLCLPDKAAAGIVAAAPPNARILDTSTAHRTSADWVYGLPELDSTQREKIKQSRRVSVPGCHATGFILLVKPLIEAGIADRNYPLTACSLTGYSGGGRKMIAEYEDSTRKDVHKSPGQYALAQEHKHLPEMTVMTGIAKKPLFTPIVGDFYSGMMVSVPLHAGLLAKKAAVCDIREVLGEYYMDEPMIGVSPDAPKEGFIYAAGKSGQSDLEIYVCGSDERIVLTALYDNLGKGASGAAIQSMNIMLGIEETKGLL